MQGASSCLSDTLDMTSAISSSVPFRAGESNKTLAPLIILGLALGDGFRHDQTPSTGSFCRSSCINRVVSTPVTVRRIQNAFGISTILSTVLGAPNQLVSRFGQSIAPVSLHCPFSAGSLPSFAPRYTCIHCLALLFFLPVLWQYRIILSADTASEVRQMPSQKRR